jgi:hypothetical protein
MYNILSFQGDFMDIYTTILTELIPQEDFTTDLNSTNFFIECMLSKC